MKTLKIKWQRLVSHEQTCPRCRATEKELEKAISVLKKSLIPVGIDVVLEKNEISLAEFKKDPLQSNQIWLNDKPLEDWIGGRASQSPCCDICSPYDCRTIEIGEEIYETIPAELIIKASLLAVSQLIAPETDKSCCENSSSNSCCLK